MTVSDPTQILLDFLGYLEHRLDREYLLGLASRAGLTDLLERALNEAGL